MVTYMPTKLVSYDTVTQFTLIMRPNILEISCAKQ